MADRWGGQMTRRNVGLAVGGVVLVALVALYLSFGTISPCGIVRAEARHDAQRQGGFGALASALPDSLIDGLISSVVGPLSPGKCLALAFTGLPSQPPAPVQAPVPAQELLADADPLKRAGIVAGQAVLECKQKRLIGLLKNRVESAECSNAKITSAFQAAHYRYMDLIGLITANRLAAAEAIDQGKATEAQENLAIAELFTRIVDEEHKRDSERR